MERDIIKIDNDLCNGCGDCIPSCHEGALQIIDGKAVLISDLMCDGLGACIGHCPLGAITMEKREAEPYDEILVIKDMVNKGKNTVVAHLQHLKEHNEMQFMKQGVMWLEQNRDSLDFDLNEVKHMVHNGIKPEQQDAHPHPHPHAHPHPVAPEPQGSACGCPGAAAVDFNVNVDKVNEAGKQQSPGDNFSVPSELRQWPVQLHLLNPQASYFHSADVVLAADCTAFSMGNFHSEFIKGKTLAIACPKLDSNMDIYVEKLASMIDNSGINTLTVVIMEVPCCGGLIQMAQAALSNASRKIPLKRVIVSIQGQVTSEDWV